MIYDIREFGAVGDGNQLNTDKIQTAIDTCANEGGGRVLVSEGIYITGTIILKSNVNLHISANGVLLGSADCNNYPERKNTSHVESKLLPRKRNACMIFAEESENISITGDGAIDCNGEYFVRRCSEHSVGWKYERIDMPTPPRVVFFTGCRNVNIRDITMRNQPSGWSYWIHDCDYVTFDRCKITANVNYPNNDGIHINSSRNVTVSNCMISCGDDCIIVRANNSSLKENKICEKVTVTNCNLTSYSGGIRIGWINDGVIRNCTFSNIVMTDTTVGISIVLPGRGEERIPDEGRENTLIENLSFNNIIMDRIYSNPVLIKICDNKAVMCSAIQNLYFNNLHVRGLEFMYIQGRKDNRVKNIMFSDCTFEKLTEDDLPDYKHHGAAAWDRHRGEKILFADNVTFTNTSFSTK